MSHRGFKQTYVIRVPLKVAAITIAYAGHHKLLSDAELVYPDPKTILCDFELAVTRAVEQVLGQDAAIQGCIYHFTQATWRKIQDL